MSSSLSDVSSGVPTSRESAYVSISVATMAAVAAALLIYVGNSFVLTEILGIKRLVQGLLVVPLAFAACYYVITRPGDLWNPLVGFVVVKTLVEFALRSNWLDRFDNIASLVGLIVVCCVPERSFRAGARTIVWVAGIFAVMSLVQWVALFLFPYLANYCLIVSDEGVVSNTVRHPIALLGTTTGEEYSLFGYPVSRLQSFTKEPSLHIVYFMFPAVLAFLQRNTSGFLLGSAMVLFCILSFSGSVFLALAFTMVWWVALHLLPIRVALIYGAVSTLVVYGIVIKVIGLQTLLLAVTFLTQYGDFLDKSRSLPVRANAAAENIDIAMSSPLGASTLSDMAGPWPVNGALAAGWLGVLLLFFILRALANELERADANWGRGGTRLAILLLLGMLTTIIVFNDYQMSNYAGLVLLAFTYRTMRLDNENADSGRRELEKE